MIKCSLEFKNDDFVLKTFKLCKEFGKSKAVSDLDLNIPKGIIYGLIGPNGSGKTTTIRMLVGLLRISSGSAMLLGEKVPIVKQISNVGYMPQEIAVYSDLTVYENLSFFAHLYSLKREKFQQMADELLKMTDLYSRRDSLIQELSGGMKHRVSLACSLIHDPELIFLDEPTVGVDPELRVGFWDYFDNLKRKGKTIIMTTHYMDEAMRCDLVGMRLGELIAEGTPDELIDRAKVKNLEEAFLRYSGRQNK